MSYVIDFRTDAPVAGCLDVRWHAGHPSPADDPAPAIQVHAYSEHTLILRQNKSVHFEAPFLFLLFGNERALLLDSGATADPSGMPLRATVDALIDAWLRLRPREGRQEYGLIVAHTHAHGDHIAGDWQFADRPHTETVGPSRAEVISYFGFEQWPLRPAELDLGGRVLDLLPGPGHEESAVVFHDRHTGLLLTGDSLYPGRLYVKDLAAFTATVDRLLAFCETTRVTHVLGCHIEMTRTPDQDYPRGTTYQPDEPPLELTPGHLRRLSEALAARRGPSGDFIVVYEE